MRIPILLALIILLAIPSIAQRDIDKLAATERAFASMAAEKGTKQAFLANLADDGIVFVPDRTNGKAFWSARGESPSLLSWAPNYADVSSNGLLGYTTGNWEFRAKGKDDAPSAFGDFVTVWQRMPDGNYRFVVDIGINHDKPVQYSTELAAPSYPPNTNEKNSSAADSANTFFEIAGKQGIAAAYKTYAAENVRAYREGNFPLLGRGKLLSFVRKEKADTKLTKRTVFFQSADLAYVTNTYSKTLTDGKTENGNFLQIWKLVDGRWQIVLDIFKPMPQK